MSSGLNGNPYRYRPILRLTCARPDETISFKLVAAQPEQPGSDSDEHCGSGRPARTRAASELLRALASPTRIGIVLSLRTGFKCVHERSGELGLSGPCQPTPAGPLGRRVWSAASATACEITGSSTITSPTSSRRPITSEPHDTPDGATRADHRAFGPTGAIDDANRARSRCHAPPASGTRSPTPSPPPTTSCRAELHDQLKRRGESISLTTVYRNLRALSRRTDRRCGTDR